MQRPRKTKVSGLIDSSFCSTVVPGYLTLKALRHGSHSFTCSYTNACLYFVNVHQMALLQTEVADTYYYSFIYPERMKGWAGLVGWPTADGLPKTNVLPLCHATNHACSLTIYQ